jgi:hypothetical protein
MLSARVGQLTRKDVGLEVTLCRQGIRDSSCADQRSGLGVYSWTAVDMAGLPAPVGAETASVPRMTVSG